MTTGLQNATSLSCKSLQMTQNFLDGVSRLFHNSRKKFFKKQVPCKTLEKNFSIRDAFLDLNSLVLGSMYLLICLFHAKDVSCTLKPCLYNLCFLMNDHCWSLWFSLLPGHGRFPLLLQVSRHKKSFIASHRSLPRPSKENTLLWRHCSPLMAVKTTPCCHSKDC